MTDLTYLDPPLELVANAPRQAPLASRIRAAGLRPIPVGESWTAGSRVPLLVDVASVSATTLEQLEKAAREGLDRPVILLAAREGAGIDLHDCLLLRGDEEIATLSARLELRRRRATRTSETALRRETARQLGGLEEWVAPEADRAKQDVLYLGEGGSFFQMLRHGFARCGHDLVAALSVPTAESYLASGRFALVCLNASGGQRDVLELLERTALGQIRVASPIALVTDAPALLRDPVCLEVADEVLAADMGHEAILDACHAAMANGLPAAAPGRVRLSSALFDAHTRLYSRRFLDAHLPEQMRVCDQLEAPLCLLSLRVNTALPAAERARQMQTLAHIVTGDLRVTDLATRAGATDIVISLRETPHAGAARLARRIAARVQAVCPGPERPDFSWRIAERRASHTAETLIDAALSGTFMRAAAAA